jgi:hypothetical protein
MAGTTKVMVGTTKVLQAHTDIVSLPIYWVMSTSLWNEIQQLGWNSRAGRALRALVWGLAWKWNEMAVLGPDLCTLGWQDGETTKAMRGRMKQPSNIGLSLDSKPGPRGWQPSMLPLSYAAPWTGLESYRNRWVSNWCITWTRKYCSCGCHLKNCRAAKNG